MSGSPPHEPLPSEHTWVQLWQGSYKDARPILVALRIVPIQWRAEIARRGDAPATMRLLVPEQDEGQARNAIPPGDAG